MSDDLRRLSPDEIANVLETGSGDSEGEPTVVGVLLAAGGSTRFGDANKLLAELDGEPLVRHAARTLVNTDLSKVVVVLGCDSNAIREAVCDLSDDGGEKSVVPMSFVTNPDYGRGLSTSVRAGVAAVDAGADAVVFLPGDMPAVDPATVDLLIDAYRGGFADAIAASDDGRRGNPVLFGDRHFPALREIRGDVGGKPVLLDAHRGAVIETDDPGVVRDVDTRDDLERRR